jgi:hypothetical protein
MTVIDHKVLNTLAATVAVTGMVLAGIADIAGAAVMLNNSQSVSGFIRNNSPSFRFKNQSRTGTLIQRAAGEEYVFNAKQGDMVSISVDAEEGSSLSPVLVLISSQTRQQVAYDDTTNSLEYQVPTSGEYRLLVLGQNNTRGRYTLSISGLSEATQVSQADQVMKDVLQLRTIGCGVPNVAKIIIGSEERCTRDIEPGQYVYDQASKSIKPTNTSGQTNTDEKRQLLQNDYGLKVLDSCPTNRSSVAVVSFPESGQTNTYCATPNRLIPAGQYTYNASTGKLDAAKKPKQCTLNVAGTCIVK